MIDCSHMEKDAKIKTHLNLNVYLLTEGTYDMTLKNVFSRQ